MSTITYSCILSITTYRVFVKTLESRKMALCGKVSTAYEGEATAAKFYNVFRKQLQLIPNISSEVQGARLLEGEWDKVGAVIHWEYTIGN